MSKKSIIKGNQDGTNGRNESYIVNKHLMTRKNLVKQVENGEHKGFHIIKVNGEKYVRDNPDGSKSDNVND